MPTLRDYISATIQDRDLFPSLRYFNFFKDVFKTEISKNDKNFLDLKTSDIVDNALHGNVLINMWHNYSRGKNVIMTSSMLAFSDDATTQKRVF